MKDFSRNSRSAAHHDDRYGRTTPVPRKPSQQEIEAEARKFANLTDTPLEVMRERVKKTYELPVLVYHYGKPGESDYNDKIHKNKKIAGTLAAREGNSVTEDYAWESEDGSLKLLTPEEMDEYEKTHPGFFE